MRKFNSMIFKLFAAACVATFVSSGFIAPVAFAADKKAPAKDEKKVTNKVGVALKAASELVAKQQYDEALKKVAEAEAVEKKTPYDQYKIDEFRAHIYIAQKTKFPEVLAIYEKFLTTPEFMDPQTAEMLPKQLTQLAFQIQDHAKVQEYGKRWLATHPDDSQNVDIMARSSYMTKDYPNALKSVQEAIKIAEAANKTPDEIWMQLAISSAANMDNEAQILSSYEKLVRYYPKPEHWGKLLARSLQLEKNELGVLYVFRLMGEVGALTKAEQYLEYAQLATEKAVPGEAAKVLQAGFDKNLLGSGKDKEVQQRKLAEAKQKAQADKNELPEIEKNVRAGKANGQLSAGLGLAYYSFDMYEQAIQAIEAGLAKGGVRNVDDSKMILGISYLRAGQKEKARAQFDSIGADSPLARVAKLWSVRTYN